MQDKPRGNQIQAKCPWRHTINTLSFDLPCLAHKQQKHILSLFNSLAVLFISIMMAVCLCLSPDAKDSGLTLSVFNIYLWNKIN